MSRRQREVAPPLESAPDDLDDGEWDIDDDENEEIGEDAPSELESEEEEEAEDAELRAAVHEYQTTAARIMNEEATRGGRQEGDEDDIEDVVDPGSDSSEDERPNRNTIGSVPLAWYKHEDHIGYDKEGGKIIKSKKKDQLDKLLDRNDSKKALRTIYDEYNDEEITLSKDELAMIMRIRKGQFPSLQVNPFEDYNDYFSSQREVMPINDAPEPKRRFIPSKHEEKKIIKLVRAIRNGWLKKEEKQAEAPAAYLLWADDNLAESSKTAIGLSYIPPAKPKLPGHAESYNPPKEYLPTEEERQSWQLMDPEERPKVEPKAFDSLRHVPAYASFIKEIFERCLDLYLCPRVRKKRMHVNPESLVPQLPKPRDLQPFPTTLAHKFIGHKGKVRSIAPDPTGQWLLSGSDDGTVKVWEVRTGRCHKTWDLESGAVYCVAWCPSSSSSSTVEDQTAPPLDGGGRAIWSACVGNKLVLMPSGLGGAAVVAAARDTLKEASSAASASKGADEGSLASWSPRVDGGMEVVTKFSVRDVSWHSKGDYFATVSPSGNTQAVLVHQMSKALTQNPFKKNKGKVAKVAFHPSKPFFFVAAQNHVRIYNLAKQALSKKLVGGSGTITCMSVHPSGDHVIVGSEDKRLAWYDLDLSDKPYKALRYHSTALRATAFHRTYPLFASSSDDATVHVFHGTVYADLMSNPLIVPVKVLRGHDVEDYSGVLSVAFHPHQPWIFSAGADSHICLWCN